METPRPPFMKSLIIFFPSIFLAKKIDDFEGCLKGVAMCLNADSTLLVNTALAQAQPPRNRLLQLFYKPILCQKYRFLILKGILGLLPSQLIDYFL